MKRVSAFLLAACIMLSGCGQGNKSREKETTGEAAEQITEIETESETKEETEEAPAEAGETETRPEPTVTICTGIESEILERDETFSQIDLLDTYLDAREFSLIKLNCPTVYQMPPYLYEADEAEEWTEEDWDLVRPLEQITTTAMGYGKIDYNNDGKKEYIYRTVENGMAAAGYEVSEDGKSIIGEYNLLDIFPQPYDEENIPLQLWFRQIGDSVVSFSLLENTETTFTVYAFLVAGDSVSVLEKRRLYVKTKEVPESEAYSDENIYASQSQLWDVAADDITACNLSREEIKSLRQDRDIKIQEQETGLPGELVEALQNLLIKEAKDEESSIDDCLESYQAKSCELDEDYVLELLENSEPFEELKSAKDAYMADLDGDGKEEIILCGNRGGNSPYWPIEIWSENENGTGKFARVEVGYGRRARLFFIDGKYYYVAGIYDYDFASTVWRVYSFSEGKTVRLDEITMKSQEREMMWTKLYENEDMDSGILESIQAYVRSRKSEIEGDEVLRGEAEEPYLDSGCDFLLEAFFLSDYASDCSLVDVDNDGERECCYKRITHNGSSAGGPDWLWWGILKKRGPYVKELESDFMEEFYTENVDYYTWQLWFEEFDGKNYIFQLERLDGSLDSVLTVQLIQNNKLYPVFKFFLLDDKVCTCEKIER